MKILFIGGTGVISSACARAAASAGMDVTLLNRGRTSRGADTPAVKTLLGDIHDVSWARSALAHESFDVVVDWIAFKPDHVRCDIEMFRGRVSQYVFISSATVYQMPPPELPIIESMPRSNPNWAYAKDKITCEQLLFDAHRTSGFPVTIVRPSHTYDLGMLPVRGGWAAVDRMRRGLETIVPGDGTNLWTLTHHEDFARGFVGLLGLDAAFGEAVHITSDEALSWNDIHETVARAAGAKLRPVHVPYEVIASFDREWGESLLGDKAYAKVFDNSKIRRLVPAYRAVIPYSRGAAAQIAWYDADRTRQKLDAAFDVKIERILAHVASA